MKVHGGMLVPLVLLLAGCSLAGDITPPPSLATAQAAETLPPPTVAPTAALPASAPTAAPTLAAEEAASDPTGTGMIRGTVTNGTPGGTLSAGLEAVLSGFDGEEETYRESAALAEDGSFSFANVPAVPGRVYGVTVAYGDVLYFSEGAHLAGGPVPLDLPVTVFDVTTDAASLNVERLHLLFDFSTAGQVQVIELWVLSNAGDRTLVAEPSRGAVEVGLPERASELAFEDGLVGDRFVLTETGFGDRNPVIPGTATSQFIFSYQLPYDGSLRFERPSGYPVRAVVVLLPQGGIRARGEGLQDLGSQQMGGQPVHTYSGGGLPAGQALEIELEGDPGAEGSAEAAAGGWANTAVGLGVLGLLLIVVGLWWFRPGRSHRRGPSPEAETDRLITEIAGLDDAWEAGGMDEPAYRARRETLKRALRERMR